MAGKKGPSKAKEAAHPDAPEESAGEAKALEEQETPTAEGNGQAGAGPERAGDAVDNRQLEMIGDVTLPLTVELGCARFSIKDILKFAPGSVIELNKTAGDPVEIYLYETQIARGEIIIVRDRYAVKITDIVRKEGRFRDIHL